MGYKKDTDYQKLINDAVSKRDFASASRYEQERNTKIDSEGLSYDKTYNYVKPTGMSDTTYNKINTQYQKPNTVTELDSKANGLMSDIENIKNEQIISNDVKKGMNSTFKTPSSVTQADAWLSNQLSVIQSGKTSWSDEVTDMINQIKNREKFSYDVDKDPLFQQALASATNSGKQAMQDTIGQASALTGGYGSSYATSVGNQTYNSFIEDAYDQLPQYYQMARETYQMEGDEMYRQLGMYNEADDREYNRTMAAYDATYQMRNRQYDEAYGRFRDYKSDAFSMANLQLNEHNTKMNDVYNLYNTVANQSDRLYERSYNEWLDGINQAWKMAETEVSNYWEDKTFNENVRQYEKIYAQNEDHFTRNMNFQDKWNQNDLNYKYSALAQDERQHQESLAASLKEAQLKADADGYNFSQEDLTTAFNSKDVQKFISNALTPAELSKRKNRVSIDGKARYFDSYEKYIDALIESKYKKPLSEHQVLALKMHYGIVED